MKKEISLGWLCFGAAFSFLCLLSLSLCVLLSVFGGGEAREVTVIPNFVGTEYEELNGGAHLDLEYEYVYSEDVPEGVVISQTPAASSRRKVALPDGKCLVKLVISLGAEREGVPSVVGMKYNAAVASLRQAGFAVRTVPVYGDGVENDRVIKVSPDEHTELERGERVTLFVNRVKVEGTVEVEDYRGLEKSVACKKILELGLFLRIVQCEYSDDYEIGTVMAQSIPSGARVKQESYIDITVSAGKEPCFASEEMTAEEQRKPDGEVNGKDKRNNYRPFGRTLYR